MSYPFLDLELKVSEMTKLMISKGDQKVSYCRVAVNTFLIVNLSISLERVILISSYLLFRR